MPRKSSYPPSLNVVEEYYFYDRHFKMFLEQDELQERVKKLGEQILEDLWRSSPKIVFVVVLKGAVFFACDLIRATKLSSRIEFMQLSSYDGQLTRGDEVKTCLGITTDLTDCTVILIEDIVETGSTLDAAIKQIKAAGASEIKVATLFFKPKRYKFDYPIDYIGFSIDNHFLFGYGLDYKERGRGDVDVFTPSE